MLLHAPSESHLRFQWLLTEKSIRNRFRQLFTQKLSGKHANRTAVEARRERRAIQRKLARRRVPHAERHDIQSPQLKASAHDEQDCLARRLEYPDGQRRMENSAGQKQVLPWDSVILEKPFTDDEHEMEMEMDELTAAFIVAENAQRCRMIAIGHGWKELEIPLGQYHQHTMLVGSRDQQVNIARTVAGMSGSPIYLGGKMIGAYAYGWLFGVEPIAGVTPNLLDSAGNLLGVTVQTDATGLYCFTGLRPGTYGVSEVQPGGYYDGLDTPGNAGGTAHNPGDRITGAVLTGALDSAATHTQTLAA